MRQGVERGRSMCLMHQAAPCMQPMHRPKQRRVGQSLRVTLVHQAARCMLLRHRQEQVVGQALCKALLHSAVRS